MQVVEAMLSERQWDREEVDRKDQNEHQAAQLLGANSMEYLKKYKSEFKFKKTKFD